MPSLPEKQKLILLSTAVILLISVGFFAQTRKRETLEQRFGCATLLPLEADTRTGLSRVDPVDEFHLDYLYDSYLGSVEEKREGGCVFTQLRLYLPLADGPPATYSLYIPRDMKGSGAFGNILAQELERETGRRLVLRVRYGLDGQETNKPDNIALLEEWEVLYVVD